jgi:hypothetical protein
LDGAVTLEIRVACDPGQAHVALVRNDDLIDYALWRPGSPDGVGDIFRGRIGAVVPSMAGAFVVLDGADGFLPDSAGAKGLTVGRIVKVRVTRAAIGGKGPRLAAVGPDVGEIGLLERGPNPVARFAALESDAPILVDDLAMVAALRPILGTRVAHQPDVLGDTLSASIAALAERDVILPGGARMSIWPTPALTAIDIDGGSLLTRERHRQINRSVMPVLATQLRLRNVSGAIVLDMAGLSVRQRKALGPEITAALADDPLRPRFLGFTALGLAEIVRPRVHQPLHELLNGPLAEGLAALKAVRSAFDGVRIPALRANPGVVAALEADGTGLEDILRQTGRAVTVRADPAQTTWMLENDHG